MPLCQWLSYGKSAPLKDKTQRLYPAISSKANPHLPVCGFEQGQVWAFAALRGCRLVDCFGVFHRPGEKKLI